MASVDDIVSIDFAEEISTFQSTLLSGPVDSLDQVLSIGVGLPPVLVRIWTFDVREYDDEAMGSEMFEGGTVHSPLSSGSVHVAH